jgi:hypothetical protein
MLAGAGLKIAYKPDHAIDQGADELWIIWTTSMAGRWRNGPVGEFGGQTAAATCVANVRPVRTGFAEPTVGNSDWSQA